MIKYILTSLFFIPSILFSLSHERNVLTADTVRFICQELLGRPTDNSIVINFCTDADIDVYAEYGLLSGSYSGQTSTFRAVSQIPFNLVISNLLPGRTYFYRLKYKKAGGVEWVTRGEHSFRTAKPKGDSFVFAVEADPHLDYYTDPELLKITFNNIATASPDFVFDLGDTFMSEKLQHPALDSVTIRHLLLRSYFDLICHSIPLYLVIGNHEGELGWLLDGTPDNLAVITSNTRTKYFPNPIPDNFYSGNNKSEPFVGLRQNFYSWEWGNALFVVLDPYWYTMNKPNIYVDNWSWTLGKEQYEWFKGVLERSSAKFKFVFAHQIIGGGSTDGRGGAEAVPFYEMGGKNKDGSWGFTSNRGSWEMPIHQLMVKHGVNVFFHGHDHFYAKQELDGIIYQEVPQPGNPNYKNAGPAEQYGYTSGTIIPCSGFLKITVNQNSSKVEYVRSYLPSAENNDRINGMISDSYTINPAGTVSASNTGQLPDAFKLLQNYPNPFNPRTTLKYSVPESNAVNGQVRVSLKVFDIMGREVATLVDEMKGPGTYSADFNPSLYGLASGVYFYRLTAGSLSQSRKMVYLR